MATKAEIEKLELDNALLRQENDDIRRKLRSDVNALEARTKLAKAEQDFSALGDRYKALDARLVSTRLYCSQLEETQLKNTKQGKIWLDAWLSVASSSNCLNKHSASVWADSALEEYNKRFGR